MAVVKERSELSRTAQLKLYFSMLVLLYEARQNPYTILCKSCSGREPDYHFRYRKCQRCGVECGMV